MMARPKLPTTGRKIPLRAMPGVSWQDTLAEANTRQALNTFAERDLDDSRKTPGYAVGWGRTATGAVATGTTVTPYDDTIPQITEGTQILSLSYTPKVVGNRLRILVSAYLAHSAAGTVTMALHQGTKSNAVAAGSVAILAGTVDMAHMVFLAYEATIGDLTTVTWSARAGSSAAGTITLNGAAAARQLGGVYSSFLEISEVAN